MRIIVTGAHGLVGSALLRSLLADGHQVTALVRRQSSGGLPAGVSEVQWDPAAGRLDAAQLEGDDAAVHLAGENIAEGRWTEEKKRRIRESRVRGTRLLSETLARLARRPRVLVAASAVGIYGDRGNEVLTEESAAGADFLAQVCKEWEAATEPARAAGVRVVNLRIGVVLAREGGALQKMLPPFKLGVGGKIGDGSHYMSWIVLDDVVGVIRHALAVESLQGPVNTVAPEAVTNAEFTKALGRALNRPTFFPVPLFGLRLAYGELADVLTASQRVAPARLEATNYRFKHPTLEGALRRALDAGR